MVDAEPVREHLKRLQEHNKGRGTIAREADVSPSVISSVLYCGRDGKPVKRIRAATADAILAVTEEPSHLVPAMGARRRLQALAAIGHPQAQLATRLNKTRAGLSVIMRRATVTAAIDTAVRALYDQLWDQPPVSTERAAVRRARCRAEVLGWRVPMEWGDTALDDQTRTVEEFKQEAARLVAEGLSLRVIGRRLGCAHGRVSRALDPAAADRVVAS
jgi:hypothetical protein